MSQIHEDTNQDTNIFPSVLIGNSYDMLLRFNYG